MGRWVGYSHRGAIFTGRITRAPFAAWARTAEGAAAVDAAAARLRWPLLARERARRRLWKELATTARRRDVVVSVQSELDSYLTRLQALAYADGLPRAGVDLHRLVVVPRVLVNGATCGAILSRLNASGAFAGTESGAALREFFAVTLVQHLDEAIAGSRPSLKRPIATGKDWISVGVNACFVWAIPMLKQPEWNGHHYVLELTRSPITRAVRKAAAAEIARLEALLPSLSRVERNEILRRAAART